MKIGVSVFFPNQSDWPRFIAMEQGQDGPSRPKKADHEVWAENLVILDNLLAGSGRKVSIGLGRGAARREFKALGIDMNESRQRFNESVEVIKLALTNDRFSYNGKIYKFENVELRPQPRDGQ